MTTGTSWITQRPHPVSGVEGCIRDTNINVWGLVQCRRLGWSDQLILDHMEGVTAEDLEAAWEYAAAHPRKSMNSSSATKKPELHHGTILRL